MISELKKRRGGVGIILKIDSQNVLKHMESYKTPGLGNITTEMKSASEGCGQPPGHDLLKIRPSHIGYRLLIGMQGLLQ